MAVKVSELNAAAQQLTKKLAEYENAYGDCERKKHEAKQCVDNLKSLLEQSGEEENPTIAEPST